MANIDESKWKPRRTRGTPSYYYRNRFAAAIITGGTLIFGVFALTPIWQVANQKLLDQTTGRSDAEIARKALFSHRRSDEILKLMEERKKVLTEQ